MKRKGIEALKSALIILLIIMALVMIVQTALTAAGIQYSWRDLTDRFFGNREENTDGELSASHAALPVQAAVMSQNGIFAVGSGFEELDRVYDSFSQIFSEALGSAKEPAAITGEEWLKTLGGEGVYMAFDVCVPLSCLAGWMSGTSSLEFAADRFVLSVSGENVCLCYSDGASFFSCDTSASSVMLLDRMEQYRPNGARFAFQLAETWDVYNNVDPASVVPPAMSAGVYGAENSLDTQSVNALMESLLINPFTESGYIDERGNAVYLCAGGTLKISPDGYASYELNSTGKTEELFTAGQNGAIDLGGAIEKTRQFAQKTVSSRCGSARVYLSAIEQTQSGYAFTYSYYIDAMKAFAGEGGFAARFEFEGSAVSKIELCYARFESKEQQLELMQPLYAAATYPALKRARLCAAYTRTDEGLFTAWWHIG